MNTLDVVIIGGGAAGLSAALVLSRARRSVAVCDTGTPRNAPAAQMRGYLTRDGMAPGEVTRIGRDEVARYGGVFIDEAVTRVERCAAEGFDLTLASGIRIEARRVLVATGLTDIIASLPDVGARWGKDVLHCPYCHGFEVADQALGVLGGSPRAVHHALLVRQWSNDVVFFTHTSELTPDEREQLVARDVCVVGGRVVGLDLADDALHGVVLADGAIVERDALFVRPDFAPRADFFASLGAETDSQGWPIVDPTGRTTAPGLWAAGNAANPRAQVITAAGEGSAAAIAMNNDLVTEDVRNAVVALRAGSPA